MQALLAGYSREETEGADRFRRAQRRLLLARVSELNDSK